MANPSIEQLEERVKHLRRQLWHAEGQLKEARVALAPFKVGDQVEMRAWRQGRETWLPAVVQEVTPSGRGFRYTASLIKKDGTPYRFGNSWANIRAAQ